jgi:DNA-binding transcriptional LysR family regulator
MTLRQFQIFIVVASRLNLRAAAEDLHIAQSSISQHLRFLQEEFGVQLHRKTGSVIELTPAGAFLLKEATVIISQAERLKTKLQNKVDSGSMSLTIGGSYTASTTCLPWLLANFKKTHEHVRIDLRTDDGPLLARLVLKGDLDLAISHDRPKLPQLAVEPFGRDPIIVCVARNHPLAKKQCLTRDDARRFGFIARRPQGITLGFTNILKRLGFKPKVVMQCDSTEAKKAALRKQMGFALIFKSLVENDLKKGDLVALRLPADRKLYGKNYFIYQKNKVLSPAAADFMQLLRDYRVKMQDGTKRERAKGHRKRVLDGFPRYFNATKKPSISRGLKDGAGEEGRTPDLMLGKHTL